MAPPLGKARLFLKVVLVAVICVPEPLMKRAPPPLVDSLPSKVQSVKATWWVGVRGGEGGGKVGGEGG